MRRGVFERSRALLRRSRCGWTERRRQNVKGEEMVREAGDWEGAAGSGRETSVENSDGTGKGEGAVSE